MNSKPTLGTIMILACSLISSAAFASNKTIKGAYVGCLSKSTLSEFITAAGRKDYRHINALMRSGCVSIEGQPYSLVKAGFATVKIRVYAGGGSVVLYTVREAISN